MSDFIIDIYSQLSYFEMFLSIRKTKQYNAPSFTERETERSRYRFVSSQRDMITTSATYAHPAGQVSEVRLQGLQSLL